MATDVIMPQMGESIAEGIGVSFMPGNLEGVDLDFTLADNSALSVYTTRPDTLMGHAVKGALETAKVKGEEVHDVVVGCAFPEGEPAAVTVKGAARFAVERTERSSTCAPWPKPAPPARRRRPTSKR